MTADARRLLGVLPVRVLAPVRDYLEANLPPDQEDREQAARDAWTSIDRPDLVASLDQEFGPGT
jgi:hypothetical protein